MQCCFFRIWCGLQLSIFSEKLRCICTSSSSLSHDQKLATFTRTANKPGSFEERAVHQLHDTRQYSKACSCLTAVVLALEEGMAACHGGLQREITAEPVIFEHHNHALEAWTAQLHLLPASKAWVLVIFTTRFQLHKINRLFEVHVAVGITNMSNIETPGRETSTVCNQHQFD